MNQTYNILEKNWIPVVDLEGNAKRIGLKKLLLSAHTLKEVSSANPMTEFSIYRFLSVFVMDMLRPETGGDIEDILEKGEFDPDDLAAYLDICEKEGVCFDLFDEKKPFMQALFNPDIDKNMRAANYLDIVSPQGNNPVHVNHCAEGELSIPFEDVLPNILSSQIFATAGIQGFPSSINGAPPYFAVIKGESLFQTICYMLVPIEEIDISFDEPKVFWREQQEIVPKQVVTRTSWLYGMLFPARRIIAIPDWETETVKSVYYSQGLNFTLPDNWTDPEVTYRTNDTGRFPWRPDRGKAAWRNIYDLIDIGDKKAPEILRIYMENSMGNYADISLYGVETSQASYLQVMYHDMRVPAVVVQDPVRVRCLKECVLRSENVALQIRLSISQKNISKKLESLLNASINECIQRFYHSCENELWHLCDGELVSESFDEKTTIQNWSKKIAEYATEAVRMLEQKVQLSSENLILFYQLQAPLSKYLYKLRKGGEEE